MLLQSRLQLDPIMLNSNFSTRLETHSCRPPEYKQVCEALMKWLIVLHFGLFSKDPSSKPHRLALNVLLSCRCQHIGARSTPSTCCCRQSAGIEYTENHALYLVYCRQATEPYTWELEDSISTEMKRRNALNTARFAPSSSLKQRSPGLHSYAK